MMCWFQIIFYSWINAIFEYGIEHVTIVEETTNFSSYKLQNLMWVKRNIKPWILLSKFFLVPTLEDF
jgi:hypothetical protein